MHARRKKKNKKRLDRFLRNGKGRENGQRHDFSIKNTEIETFGKNSLQ